MGVPKFYRWISERYPCLSQVVRDYQIPEFDNFYLDMNGIIHMCSHPNDDDPMFRIPEDQIFSEIFKYIEALFRIIKPRKVIFLAVDGVAPRAKMNQQRGRRFRSAREAEDVVRKALQKGLVLPTEPRFDSNCITPGTEFMARLHEQLKYFVNQKVATDPSWQSVDVVLSGQEVPGEGEHKIMDYIRHQKAQPDYDPNTRHCLYGLDADLLMLGLLTHEPHFCLLREEVRFGRKSQRRSSSPTAITFHLLHLAILREYIEHEFAPLQTGLPFPYNLESVIDDWVLLGFLVGNDFLPNLPNMHIKQSALPQLYKKYMEVLPKLDGYINEAGNLNMRRFEVFLGALAEFDYDHYSELISDMKWLEAKKAGSKARQKKTARVGWGSARETLSGSEQRRSERGRGGGGGRAEVEGGEGERELVGFFSAGEGEVSLDDLDDGSESTAKLKRDLGIPSLDSYFSKEDVDRIDTFEADLGDMKARYYQEKMGFQRISSGVLAEQAKCYVVGIQWVLSYYYHGVPSWSWFYPYHYAPFVSDVKGFGDLQIEFELGEPFLPFQQLLGVLPPASKILLPRPFQGLMMNDDSPIKDYYPVEFHTDLNGKEQEWEAVVLIPFIDEERLLAAMREKENQLTKEEVRRNSHGTCHLYRYDSEMEPFTHPSPWPQAFPDVPHSKVRCTELPAIPFPISRSSLVSGLLPGAKLDILFPGFPSLKHVDHSAHLERRGVRVFQAASRDENMCLSVRPKPKDKNLQILASELVGRQCYVGWPYLTESKVHAVSDGVMKYTADPLGKSKVNILSHTLKEKEVVQWNADTTQVSRHYAEFRGIDIPPIEVLVYANVLQGKRYVSDKQNKGTLILHKEWKSFVEPHPYDLSVIDITTHAPEYREKGITLEDMFRPKDPCFMLSNPHYGFQAEILSVDQAQVRVQVKVRLLPEPDIAGVVSNSHRLSVRYLPSFVVARELGLNSLLLSRISGNIQVEKGSPENAKEREKISIGLNLKFERRNKEMPGYCRRTTEGWAYSPAAIGLVKSYMREFPAAFSYLQGNPKADKYYESELMPANAEDGVTLAKVQEWLKKQPVTGINTVDCGGQSLDEPQIAAVERAVSDMKKQKSKSVTVARLRVKPSVLFLPSINQGAVVPDPKAEYFLYDRVINVMPHSAVPFGLKGTIVGIRGDRKEVAAVYEVLFDEEFLGGLTLRCSPNRAYCLPPSCLLDLSHGVRLKNVPKQQGSVVAPEGQNFTPQRGSYSGVVVGGSPSFYGRDYPDGHPPVHRHHGNYHQQQFNGPPNTEWGHHNMGQSSSYNRGQSPSYTPGTRGRGEGGQRGERGQGRYGGHVSDSGGSRMTDRGPWRDMGSGGRGGGRERDAPVRIIVKNPRTSGSPNAAGMQIPHSVSSDSKPKHMSPSPAKPPQQHSHRTRQQKSTDSGTGGNEDAFAAALSALEKLAVAPSLKTTSSLSNATDTTSKQKGGKQLAGSSSSGVDQRELSPSVAAMFDSIAAAAATTTGNQTQPEAPASVSDAKAGLSPTLKAMLKMEEEEEGETLPTERENRAAEQGSGMPDVIQKLMHHPRGPLLPPPGLPFQQPMPPHPLPRSPFAPHHHYHYQQQPSVSRTRLHFVHSPRGAYSSPPPPPLMPFGPPAMDPFSVLQQTCHMTGQPPPQVTVRKTDQGYYVGVVSVGKTKCGGVPCETQEEARQSAAATMNSSLTPIPMYLPMPYMRPPPIHSPYNGPPPLPPHVPPYHPQVPLAYHPRGPQPPQMAPPPFVPLQVQRRQPRQKKRPSSGGKDKNVKREKPVEQEPSPSHTATAVSAPITDDEKVVERAKLGLQGQRSTAPPDEGATALTQESEREGEGEEGGQVEHSGSIDNRMERVEMVEKCVEAAEKDRMEAQEKISSLKQTLSVVQKPIVQMEGTGGGGDMVAKAAILSALEVEVEDDSSTYVVPEQSSDAAVAPDGGGEGVVVHVVGEILGGGVGGGAEPTADQSEPNVSTVVQSGTNTTPPAHGVVTADSPRVPNQANVDQTVQTSSSTEASPATTVPSMAVKTGRQKRQLAASFSRSTS